MSRVGGASILKSSEEERVWDDAMVIYKQALKAHCSHIRNSPFSEVQRCAPKAERAGFALPTDYLKRKSRRKVDFT